MVAHEINKLDNFIAGWYMEDTTLCDKIIKYHGSSINKYHGTTFVDGKTIVDKTVKDSVDCELKHDKVLSTEYFNHLQKIIDLYIEKYPFVNGYNPWYTKESVNVQYYPVNGGYHQWHTERSQGSEPNVSRHIAFMTYLNTVTDGGETEFYHQKIKIKPEKGLTLIWGVDWTFTHRGILSPSQEKYIVTGWFNYK